MKIESVLATKSTSVITVRPDQSLKDATALLAEHDIGALIVVGAAGETLGVISERDIVREAARNDGVLAQNVSQVMTTDVITAAPEDDLVAILETMTTGHFRHLPIVDHGELCGIVSIADVVKAQLDEYRGEVDTLQTQIMEEGQS